MDNPHAIPRLPLNNFMDWLAPTSDSLFKRILQKLQKPAASHRLRKMPLACTTRLFMRVRTKVTKRDEPRVCSKARFRAVNKSVLKSYPTS